jgi:hypothetical protein
LRKVQVEVVGMGTNNTGYPGAFPPAIQDLIKQSISGKVLARRISYCACLIMVRERDGITYLERLSIMITVDEGIVTRNETINNS